MVDEGLGHVHGGDPGLLLQVVEGEHELVHAGAVAVGDIIGPPQLLPQVVGVEHRPLGGLGDALGAQGEDVAEGLHHHGEVAVKALDAADALGRVPELQAVRPLLHVEDGEEILQELLAAHGAGARSAAAVGGGEGLVEVQVDQVEAHVAGADHAHDGVEVGAVVVAQAAGVVDDLGDGQDVGVEEAQGVGVGEHEGGGVGAGGRPQGLQVHAALRIGGHVDHGEAAHGGGGRVGAVGGVGDQDLGPGGISPVQVVLLHHQQGGEFPVGAGGGLEGHGVHAGDLA